MAINVAVVGTGTAGDNIGFIALRNQLNDDTYFDFNATLVDATQVDTAAELNGYNAVVIGSGGNTAGNPFDNTAFTSALRNWAQAGGGVVMTGWGIFGAVNSTGRSDLDAIIPVNMASGFGALGQGSVLQVVNGSHPVTAFVPSFQITGNSDYTEYPVAGADSGATVLATTNGTPTAVAGQAGLGRAVYLGPIYSGNTGYGTGELRSSNPDRLLEQSVAWTASSVTIEPVSPDPRTTPVASVDVTFRDAINPASFDYHDLTLTRSGGLNLIDSGVTVSYVSGTTYRIAGLSALTSTDGIYTLSVNAAGIFSPQGVAGRGSSSDTWTHDAMPGAPTVVGTSPVNGGTLSGTGFSTMTLTFSEPVTAATAQNPTNYRLAGPAGTIPVATATLDGSGKTVTLTFASQSSGGTYSLHVGNIADVVGNAMIGLGGYSAPDIYQTPGGALSSTGGDFDGDGRWDLVATLYGSSSLAFFKGLAGGAFASGTAMNVGANSFVKELTSADLNNDGKLDLILAEQYSVGVYLGNGNGTFQARQALPMSNTNAIEVRDLDADGRPDIIAGDTSGFVRTFLNNGTSSVGFWQYLTSGGPAISDFTLADMNGDGRLDLVSNYYGNNYGYVWIGTGAFGQFSTAYGFSEGYESENTVLADIDNDGRRDVVTGANGVNVTYGTSSSPYFGPIQNLGSDSMGSYATNVQAVDLDGDGDLDLVKGGWGNGSVFLSYNQGNRTFANQAINLSGYGIQYIWQIQTPDINGDGLPDLIGTSYNTNRIFVLKSQGGVLATSFQFVANAAPVAVAGGPYSVEYGSSVTLDGSHSADPEGNALTYTWNFGDGTMYTESPTSAPDGVYDGRVQHTYSNLGTYSASLTVADGQGLTDTASVTITVRDTTPPATTASLDGALGANNWYTGPVTVTLSATEAASGVATTYYRIGGSGSYSLYSAFSKPTISADGTSAVWYYSVDVAGNSEVPRSSSFQIDRTSPVVSMTGPAANSLTINTTPTLTATASDGPSGIASVQFQISSDNGTNWTDVGTASTAAPYAAQASSVLADGIYLARAVATDVAGNRTTSTPVGFTIDATAPFLTGVSDIPDPFSPNGDGVNDSTTISYTASEASSVTVTVTDAANNPVRTLVSGLWQAAGSYSTVWDGKDGSGVIVSDGTYTYNIRATDAAGNATNSATLDNTDHTVTVDNTAPSVSITAGPTDPTHHDSASFAFSASDNHTAGASLVYQYSLNGGAYWTLSGNTLSLTSLADGRYALSVRSVDEAGNLSTAASFSWTVDTTAPTTTAVVSGTHGTNGWYVGPATVTLSASDTNGDAAVSGVAQTWYTVDGVAPQVYSAAFTLSVDGQHTITYWSVDLAGNEATPHQTISINIDQVAPTISGAPTTQANADGWYNHEVTVHFTASDGGSGLASVTADQVFGEGAGQSIEGTAVDKAGNSRSATVSGINIDLAAPTTTASRSVQPNTNGWNNTDVTVTLDATDALSGVKATYYLLDGGDVLAGTVLSLSEGDHTVEFWSVDKADNAEEHRTISVRIDEAAPHIIADRDPGSEPNEYGWNRSGVSISYAASDGLSGPPYGVESGSYVFTQENEGQSYTFTVTDLAGNSASATVSAINIDLTPPILSAQATTADGAYVSGTWTNQDVTVHFTAGDALSGLATSPEDVTVSTEGAGQYIEATVFDKAGNSAQASFTDIRIDKTAPVTTADAHGYQGEWVNHAVTINLNATDQVNLAGVGATYYAIDGGVAQAYDSSLGIVVANPGVHSVTFWSVDNAGNVEDTSTGHGLTVRIDQAAPVTIASRSGEEHAASHSGWNNTDVTVTLTPGDAGGSGLARTEYSSDGGQSWASYTAPLTLSGEGVHTILYRSADEAGNVESTATGHALIIKIDKAAPTLGNLTSPLDPIAQATGGNTVTASATFANPSGSGFASGKFTWGSGANAATTVTTLGASGALSASTVYTSVGIYQLELTATDIAGNSVTASFPNYVVIYNPANGFVTGGGWLNSPAGAYAADPTLTGKANFGFVSKYQKGSSTPTGDTRFTFGVADFKFLSTSYEWLVIAGAKAQYKGVGTVNGRGDYGFMLTAIDGKISGGGGADKFRIKIWDKATGASVYDNQLGTADGDDPTTLLGGGSIVIHKNLVLSDAQAAGLNRAEALTPKALAPAVTESIARWQAAGLDEAGLDRLRQVRFVIADLNGSTLGHAGPDVIHVDLDAAGYGWFTDVSPASDLAFGSRVALVELRADVSSPAAGRVDLLTLLMHEMGHVVGLDDLDPQEQPHDLMTEDLSPGMRRLPRGDAFGGDLEVVGPAAVFTSIPASPTMIGPRTAILLATPEPDGKPSRSVPRSARPTVVSISRRDARLALLPIEISRATPSLDELASTGNRGASSLDMIPDDLISDLALLGRKQLPGLGWGRGR